MGHDIKSPFSAYFSNHNGVVRADVTFALLYLQFVITTARNSGHHVSLYRRSNHSWDNKGVTSPKNESTYPSAPLNSTEWPGLRNSSALAEEPDYTLYDSVWIYPVLAAAVAAYFIVMIIVPWKKWKLQRAERRQAKKDKALGRVPTVVVADKSDQDMSANIIPNPYGFQGFGQPTFPRTQAVQGEGQPRESLSLLPHEREFDA